MIKSLPRVKRSFRVYLICIHGPESNPLVRVLLVETTGSQVIFDGFGTWPQCERWIERLSANRKPEGELAAARKRLDRKRLATINEVKASLRDIESLGLYRVDSSE
jgi:hypothetical protein